MQSTWSYAANGFVLTGVPHDDVCHLCTYAGFAGIEAGWTQFEHAPLAEVEAASQIYQHHQVAVSSFHLPFTEDDDICSFYEESRRRAVDRSLYWMERAAVLGADIVIQHPEIGRHNLDLEGIDTFFRQLGRSLAVLLPAAERFGVRIAIENMQPGGQSRFGTRPEHFTRMGEEFAHANFGFCLDTGHALQAMRDDVASLIDGMGNHLIHYHLADNAGDRDSHLAPGHGRVDWPLIFGSMAKRGYTGTACIETPPFDFGPDYTRDAWRDLVTETQDLVASL